MRAGTSAVLGIYHYSGKQKLTFSIEKQGRTLGYCSLLSLQPLFRTRAISFTQKRRAVLRAIHDGRVQTVPPDVRGGKSGRGVAVLFKPFTLFGLTILIPGFDYDS